MSLQVKEKEYLKEVKIFMNIDIKRLKDDLNDYFSTAINPFDVDLKGIEDIENFSNDKIIEIAKANGFNIDYYDINEENNE